MNIHHLQRCKKFKERILELIIGGFGSGSVYVILIGNIIKVLTFQNATFDKEVAGPTLSSAL